MGIKDLLRALSSESTPKLITDFKGQRIAIDSSGWLHKGLFAAAEDIVDTGIDSELYFDFLLARARNFILNGIQTMNYCTSHTPHVELTETLPRYSIGVEPVFVFDGKRNNLKSDTCKKRDETREAVIESGRKLIENMSKTNDPQCRAKLRQEAVASFQRGLDVTHAMEKSVIAGLRKLDICCIVAPYEADVQLAYLCMIGYCNAVLTEDSDLMVYSAACGVPFPILYKFDKAGTVQCLDLHSMGILASTPTQMAAPVQQQDKKASAGFIGQLAQFRGSVGRRMFVQMCVLAGCDYCESVPGIGLVFAQQAVVRFKDSPDDQRLHDIVNHFTKAGKNVAPSYLERLLRVEALFHYQPVYNPHTKDIVTFTCPPNEILSSSSSSSSKPLDVWYGPLVDTQLLRSLGSGEDILKGSPSDMTFEQMCEGLRSCKDYSWINPSFPWDNGKCASPPDGNYGRSCWSMRRNMIQYLRLNGSAKFVGRTICHSLPKLSKAEAKSSSSSSSSSSSRSSILHISTNSEKFFMPPAAPSSRKDVWYRDKEVDPSENIRDIMHPGNTNDNQRAGSSFSTPIYLTISSPKITKSTKFGANSASVVVADLFSGSNIEKDSVMVYLPENIEINTTIDLVSSPPGSKYDGEHVTNSSDVINCTEDDPITPPTINLMCSSENHCLAPDVYLNISQLSPTHKNTGTEYQGDKINNYNDINEYSTAKENFMASNQQTEVDCPNDEGISRPTQTPYSGTKRKLVDTVAIVANVRGKGKNKASKIMTVASIKSFFS